MRSAVSSAIFDLRHLTKLWLWLYLGRLILALLITLPLLAILGPSLDRSIYGQMLTGEWSLDVIGELIRSNPGFFTLHVFLAIFLGILALVIKQFLNGGIYRMLVVRRRFSGPEFFGYAVSDFGGHLRIALVMLPVYVALVVLASIILIIIPKSIFGPQGVGGLLSFFAQVAVLWICLILGSIISDLMRVSLAMSPGRTLASYWRSAWSLFRRVGVQAIGVYVVFFLPFVILWIVIEILAVQITGGLHNGLGVALEFLLFQLCSFARSGQSLLGSAGIAALAQTEIIAPPPVQLSEAV